MPEPKKDTPNPSNPSLVRNQGPQHADEPHAAAVPTHPDAANTVARATQPGVAAVPTGPPPSPGPHAPGSPHRMAGVNVEAATTRVGGTPGADLLKDAIANLEQRTIDRLPEDQKKGSRAEFQSFKEQISAIYGGE